jgi:murein DD-endopeptidase MepM/ murein hydrolase activator NlpD
MNIIFLSANNGILCSIGLCRKRHYLALMLVVVLLGGGFGYGGYRLARSQAGPDLPGEVARWKQALHQQRLELDQLQQESQATIEALSSRLGLLQAHVNRIDALGQKLIKMAKIDKGEFDFSRMPAVGGPESLPQGDLSESELQAAIDRLAASLEDRENQLAVLESLLMNRNLQAEVQPRGRPIVTGWLSSYYGMRTHPISGKREMHKGIDFASKLGAPVVAVAKGVVTFAGEKSGYGKMIDINHGNGYTTRYAHNSKLLVSVGDTVEKGFQIAEIGTSGRSTGPHVHFEVMKNGRQVNPMKFIRAAR